MAGLEACRAGCVPPSISVLRSIVRIRIADPHAAQAVNSRHPAPAAVIQSGRVVAAEEEVATMPEVRADKGDATRADMHAFEAAEAAHAWTTKAASAAEVSG